MRTLRLLVVSVFVLFLSGCWVYTLNPLYEEYDISSAFDASLAGTWINPLGKCSLTMMPDNPQYPSYYKVVYRAPDPETGGCLIDPGKIEFEGRIVTLGSHRFLDLAPVPQDLCVQCWAMHSIYLVSLENDELTVVPIDHTWLKQAIQDKKLKIPVAEGEKGLANKGTLVIMLPTKELRQFAAKFADNKKAFKPDDHYVYRRSRAAD